jgi:hypothetical protein
MWKAFAAPGWNSVTAPVHRHMVMAGHEAPSPRGRLHRNIISSFGADLDLDRAVIKPT